MQPEGGRNTILRLGLNDLLLLNLFGLPLADPAAGRSLLAAGKGQFW